MCKCFTRISRSKRRTADVIATRAAILRRGYSLDGNRSAARAGLGQRHRSDSSGARRRCQDERFRNDDVVAKIFMRDFVHARYLCVIEFEHISRARAVSLPLSSFRPRSLARSRSMRQFKPQFQVVAENAKRRRDVLKATLRDALTQAHPIRVAHLETII